MEFFKDQFRRKTDLKGAAKWCWSEANYENNQSISKEYFYGEKFYDSLLFNHFCVRQNQKEFYDLKNQFVWLSALIFNELLSQSGSSSLW